MIIKILINIILFTVFYLFSQSNVDLFAKTNNFELDNKRNLFIGSAYSDNISYKTLEKICNDFSGRLAGSESAHKTIDLLTDILHNYKINYSIDKFKLPGWQRGKGNYIKYVNILQDTLIAFTIGSSPAIDKVQLEVCYAESGLDSIYKTINPKNKAVLINLDNAASGNNLTRSQAIEIASKNGAKAVLFTNDRGQNPQDCKMVLMSAGSFDGSACKCPAFAISKCDADILLNSINKNITPIIELYSNDTLREINLQNLRIAYPGKSAQKVILMAHYDSWDISQGAVDNGLGTAILIDIAKLIKKYYPNNYYTIEIVWTDGEEIGLLGAKNLYNNTKDSVLAVINIDMTGSPTGINVMGYKSMIDFSQSFIKSLPGYKWNDGVKNYPWLRSDHAPFLTNGVPTFTFFAFMEKEMYKHYHSTGDNFELINPKYMSDAVAVIGLFLVELANYKNLYMHKLDRKSTIQMLKNHKLDIQMKKIGEWKED